jgi:CRISPR/Cas system-associated protein Cas5 (RAMP superfamily)
VLISKYIPILFGKNGVIEDIDILIQNISFEKFLKLWLEIENTYECKNTNDPVDAYNAYLKNYHSVSIIKKEGHFPFLKMKIIKNEIDRYVLKYRKIIRLGERHLYISPVEMEISYNLSRGSEKEIEDARYLYNLFNEKLDKALMDRYLKELKIPDGSVETYLKGKASI